MVNGHTNKEIGRQRSTTEDTVKSQVAVILRRLHVESRAQAVAVGLRLGLVDPETVSTAPRPGRRRPQPPVPDDLDDELADIGDRIRAERKARAWTRTDLGQRIGMHVNTVKRIEDGQGTIRGLVLVCKALDIPMADLLSPDWRMPSPAPFLTPAHIRVLSAVAETGSLGRAAALLRMTPAGVASHMSEIYRRTGVAGLPRGQRSAAAVQVARQHGLLSSQKRTS
jgi:DNA-binding NarL/FixJ family response regulator